MFNCLFAGARATPVVLGFAALSLLFTGCASVAPPSALPQIAQRSGVVQQLSPAAAAAGLQLGVPSRAWWQDLGDARLNEVVNLAMSRNHERLAVLASVKEARALAGGAKREGLPMGSLSAQVQRVQPSLAEVDPYQQGLPRPPAQSLVTLGQMVSWEVDLFGRVGTASSMADRQVDAALADAHGATALLQAEVVRQYIRLRQYQLEGSQFERELSLLRQRHQHLQARVLAGLADQREALALQAELAKVQAGQAQATALVHVTQAALSVLVGRSPAAPADPAWQGLMAAGDLPVLPTSLHLIQPSDLLANRPDVAKADALLRASLGAEVLTERSNLPRLSLNLGFGLNGLAGDLGGASAFRYGAGPLLQWDWLDMGRVKARVLAAQAGSERAWHGLEQTVLKALEDSESALRGWVAAQQVLEQAQQAEQTALAAANYTGVRARSGLEPSALALDHQVAHLRATREALAARTSVIESFAQVQLALAAWQPQAEVAP